MRRFRPAVQACEPRACPTMVFLFPGNALAAATPDIPTQTAADRLLRLGDQPVQVSTPPMDSPRAFEAVVNYVREVSRGQPIGLIGFSAGGALALHLAGQPGLDVRSVLDFYGPPDLRDWFASHSHDHYYQYVTSHVHVTPTVVDLLSGPTDSSAHFVAAFGSQDANVRADVSLAAFQADFPGGQSSVYDGNHGVTIYADYPAFYSFLASL